ncbi:MAG: DUF6048 family protein [Paludibacter sp.]
MQKIFVFISSLIVCMFSVGSYGQKIKKPEPDLIPVFNGITIQGDIASVVSSLVSGGETFSYEASSQVDLKHKFFPIFEIGYGGANKTSNNEINFKNSGLYECIGIDINLLSPKKDEKPTTNLFLAGIRLGMSSFPYSISNAIITDDYWKVTQSLNYPNQNAFKIWYEIVLGVRVEVTKNIFMGWSVRNRSLINQDVAGNIAPWYIPGYGNNTENNWGFNYVLGYKFQILPQKKTLTNKQLNSTNYQNKTTN